MVRLKMSKKMTSTKFRVIIISEGGKEKKGWNR